MSELKVYHHELRHNEYEEFYIKSEADKVIADLEESHKKEVGQLLIEIAGLKADYKEACDRLQTANLIKDEQLAETRHQKWKRCLAMAEICRHEWCTMYYERKNYSENKFLDHLMSKKNRHKEKWLELAEKFKDKETK
jgi:hypothetical protein